MSIEASTDTPTVPRRRPGRPPRVGREQPILETPPADDAHVAIGSSLFSDPSQLKKADASTAREEDPRTRAARRALELREHLGSMEDGTDKFYIDPRIIPDGWSYEWKTFSVLGKENPSYQVSIAHRGWEPVPRSRHPEMMPDNYGGNTIEREGMILMERPKEITDEVKAQEYRKAREQVRAKETQLGAAPPGTFERDGHPKTRPVISKSYESIPIPEK